MAVNREELIECLKGLIEICRDSEKGFQTAADHVEEPELKKFFNRIDGSSHQLIGQNGRFAFELG